MTPTVDQVALAFGCPRFWAVRLLEGKEPLSQAIMMLGPVRVYWPNGTTYWRLMNTPHGLDAPSVAKLILSEACRPKGGANGQTPESPPRQ